MGVAEDGETNDIGVVDEGVGELVGGEEGDGLGSVAEVEQLAEGGVEVYAGRDVAEDPDVLVEFAGLGELGTEPVELLGGSGGVGLAGATGVAAGEEDVVEDDEAGAVERWWEGDTVVAHGGEVGEGAAAGGAGREGGGDAVAGEGKEGAAGIELVVAAVGVVVAEGEVERLAGEGGLELGDEVADGFGKEVVVGVGRGVGDGGGVAAVEGVGEEVSAEGGEADIGGVGADGLQAGLEQCVGGVVAARRAGLLEASEGLGLIGGGGSAEDGVPFGDGGVGELGGFGGIVEGIEVDVAEEESGDGFILRGCGDGEQQGCSGEEGPEGETEGRTDTGDGDGHGFSSSVRVVCDQSTGVGGTGAICWFGVVWFWRVICVWRVIPLD